MDTLLEQVARAQRKMIRDQYATHLVWWLCGMLAVAAIAIGLPKVLVLQGLPEPWAIGWLGGAALVALIGAGITTYAWRRNQLEAAAEIDRRFELRERVASSLSLPESDRESEIGQALVNDAARSVERIDVSEKFPIRVGRRVLLPVVPAVVAFALMTLVGDRQPAQAKTDPTTTATAEQVKKSAEELRKKLAQKAKQAAEKESLKDAADLLKQVGKGVEEVANKPDTDRKNATVKLNDLAKQLEDRKKQLGGTKSLENELNKLKNLGKGPAEKAAEAMKQGNFQKALNEVKRLQEKLSKGNMSAEDRQKLGEQLGKMKQQLEKAVDAQKKAMEDLKKQIEKQKQQGNQAEADKLQQKLEQMQQQSQQMSQLEQLAQKMGQAQEAMQQGDQQAAAQAMQEMSDQLQQMQQELEEMEMLDAAMDEIEMAKQAMCEQCQGMGFGQNQGDGEGEGQGMGKGRGSGPRPDEENPTATRDSRVRQKPGRGNSVFGGQVEGPNVKGQVRQSLKEALESGETADAEALDEQRLPRARRDHAREYFEKLRDQL
ncbi:MAG: hypothetical protein AAGJ46_01565 [Planctomycetota bacterium]